MGDLINGRTPEEIKIGLRNMLETCADISGTKDTVCQEMCCPYDNDNCCHETILMGALALIQHLEAQRPKWISVKERLPENDDLVLVRANGRARETRWEGAYVLAMYGLDGWVLWDYEDDEVQHLRVLHWMPLPEPPKEEANETTD